MTYTLSMTFADAAGKKSNLSIASAKPTVTQIEVGACMNAVIAGGIFKQAFVSKAGAQLTQRSVQDLTIV